MAMIKTRISTEFQFFYSPRVFEGPQILLMKNVIGLILHSELWWIQRLFVDRIL